MAKAVFCLVETRDQAENIVDRLKSVGFSGDDVSVLLPDTSGTKDFAHEKATKAPEGTVAGAGTGGVIGGALGYLAGIGALTIPGVGPLIAAGPLMAALSGAAVGGAVGGLTGALVGMGVPEYEAKRYEGKVKEGHILISAHAVDSDEVNLAKGVFKKAGASDIATAGEEGGARVEDEDERRRREGTSAARTEETAVRPEESRTARDRPATGRSERRVERRRNPEGRPPPGMPERRRSQQDLR